MPEPRPADWFNHNMDDGGPIYMETHPGQFIVEPWNAVSSLLILIPAIYWIIKLYRQGNKGLLMWSVLILIIAGGLGSALFHAFRISIFFLFMDVLPSAILTITLATYFWIKVFRKWWLVLFIYLPIFGSRFLFWNDLPEHTAINLSYFVTGVSIGLPLMIYLYKSDFQGWQFVTGTILSFIVALVFRQLDANFIHFLPMGTHFLWHTFSALGAYFLLRYLDIVVS